MILIISLLVARYLYYDKSDEAYYLVAQHLGDLSGNKDGGGSATSTPDISRLDYNFGRFMFFSTNSLKEFEELTRTLK